MTVNIVVSSWHDYMVTYWPLAIGLIIYQGQDVANQTAIALILDGESWPVR